ncbi:MAG: hypothetical protein AAGC85_04875 [Bacteroidota bacterium]
MLNSFKQSWQKYPWRWYLGITLLIRLVYAFAIFPWMWEGDAGSYVEVAGEWIGGSVGDFYWPPGLPALLSLGFSVLGVHKLSSMALMLVGWCFWGGLIFLLLKNKLVSGIGWGALWIFGLWPAWIHHSVVPLTHLWVATCLLGVVYLFLQKKDILVGVCLLGAILIRPSSALLLPVILIFVLIRKEDKLRSLRVALVPVLSIVAWQFFLHQQTQETFFINKANTFNLYLGNHPETPLYKTWWLGSHDEDWDKYPVFQAEVDSINSLPLAAQQQAYRKLSLMYISEQPGQFAIRTLNRIRTYWTFDTFTGAWWYGKNKLVGITLLGLDAGCYLLLLTGVFLFWKPVSTWGNLQWMSFLIILFYSIPYYLVFSHPTYHLAIMPLFFFLGEWNKKPSMNLTKWAVLFLLIGMQLEWIYHMSSSL